MPLARRKPNYPVVRRTRLDKATGRRVVVPGSERKTVRQQIEEWPDIRSKEMGWGKQRGKGLAPIARKGIPLGKSLSSEPEYIRGRNYVAYGPLEASPFHFDIHTHPFEKHAAFPQPMDLMIFLEAREIGNTRVKVMSSTGPRGKEIGRTVIRAKENIGRANSELYQGVLKELVDVEPRGAGPWDFYWKQNLSDSQILEKLKGIGFRIMFIPRKGYYLNKENYRFERKFGRKARAAAGKLVKKSKIRKKEARSAP